MRFWLSVYLMAVLSTPGLPQSCLIAVKTKNAVYLGADTRSIIIKTDSITQAQDTVLKTECKIYHSGKINFAVFGEFTKEATEIANSAVKNGKTFSKAMVSFEDRFARLLSNVFDYYSTTDMHKYLQLLKDDGSVIAETIFFGFESDSSVLFEIPFILSRPESGGVRIAHGIVHKRVISTGCTDKIKDSISKEITWTNGIPSTIHDLIKIQCNSNSIYAGSEIVILKVEPKGVTWIPDKNSCLMQQPLK
jgi:hypothetical protein